MLDILTSCVLIRIVENPVSNTKLMPKHRSFQEVLWIVLAVVGLYSSKQMDSQILPDFHRISLHPKATILEEIFQINPLNPFGRCFRNILPKRSLSKLLTTSQQEKSRCLQPKKSTNGGLHCRTCPKSGTSKLELRNPFGVRDFGLEVPSKGKRIAKWKKSRVWLSVYIYIYTHKYTRSYVLMWFIWKIWMFQDCFGLRVLYGYIYIYTVDSWFAKKNNEKMYKFPSTNFAKSWFEKNKILSKSCLQDLSWQYSACKMAIEKPLLDIV